LKTNHLATLVCTKIAKKLFPHSSKIDVTTLSSTAKDSHMFRHCFRNDEFFKKVEIREARLLKLPEVAKILGLLFPQYQLCIHFDRKIGWATLSQTHLVTLVEIKNLMPKCFPGCHPFENLDEEKHVNMFF
jgi:hypothetical protein